MTQVVVRPHRSPIAPLVPGSRGFIAVLSMCMAVTALGIDALLPAFPDIRIAFGLEPGATSVTMAMGPLARVAGTGAAILGMVAGVSGALIGGLIDRQFDGTVTPLAIGFVISSVVASGAWRWAVSHTPPDDR